MSHPNQTLYLPYGAYELKATYQRNLLLSMALTTSFVVVVLACGWLFMGASDPVITICPIAEPIEVEVDLRTQYSIIQPKLDLGPSLTQPPSYRVKPSDVVVPSGLRPVDDDLFDEETPSVATNEQRAGLVDGLVIDIDGGPGDGALAGSFGMGEVPDLLPKKTDFIKVEIQPELIHSPQPVYPRLSMTIGDEGTVVIQALISKTGDVLDVAVAKSSGFGLLDDAAVKASWKYKFRPAIQNRVPIAVWVTYKVTFKLDR